MNVLNVTLVGLAEITPLVPPPPPPEPGVNVTGITRSCAVPLTPVGCTVIDPLHATVPPEEQVVLVNPTVSVAGADCESAPTLKKLPLCERETPPVPEIAT